MISLINTISQLPNVNLYIHVDNIIDNVAMKDIDLFAVLNIFIDNAVEETMTQEKGEILIQMTREFDKFSFYIENTLEGRHSTPKPENTHKGIKIIEKIMQDYPYERIGWDTSVNFGAYMILFEVYDE